MKKLFALFIIIFVAYLTNVAKAQEKVDFIQISVSKCKLQCFKRDNNNSLKLFREYQVCTIKEKLVRQGKCPMGLGVVTNIDTRPSWNPTGYTRWYLLNRYGIYLPRGTIPYGHRLNYMGEFKIDLSHSVPGKGSIFRIHGIMAKTANSIGKRESGGCTRMRNEDGLELCRMISVGTPVEIIY